MTSASLPLPDTFLSLSDNCILISTVYGPPGLSAEPARGDNGPDGDGAAFVSIPLSLCVIEALGNAPHALPSPYPHQQYATAQVLSYSYWAVSVLH